MVSMRRRWWVAIVVGVVLVIGGMIGVARMPELVRRIAVARIQAATDRPVSIDRIDLGLLARRVSIRGFRLGERDGQTPFATFERLDVSVRVLPLLVGRLSFREIALADSTVNVVRGPDGTLNFSDLIGEGGSGRPIDVTVDRFALTGGKVTLEDRAMPQPQTWTSENITVTARHLSTRSGGGSAVASSITAGAPVRIELTNVRLRPVHLQATVTTDGLDLGLARFYLAPDAPVVPERGRLTTSVTVALDARDGLRADATAHFDDVVVVKPGEREPLAIVPRMTARVGHFAFAEGRLQLGELAVDGAMNVRDPMGKGTRRFQLASVRANVADLTWPATSAGRVDLSASIPGGGTLAIAGSVRPAPDPTELRARLSNLDLGPWAQFVPVAARITGVANADLRMNEPLTIGIPARVEGSIAVDRPAVADDRRQVFAARRVEASGLEVHFPKVIVGRLLLSEPRGIVERDREGRFSATELIRRTGAPAEISTARTGPQRAAAAPEIGVEVREIVVRNGAVAWRDQAVSPEARLDVGGIEARVTGIGWPLRGPAGVHLALRPPGGGRLEVSGRVGIDPAAADVRVIARGAELAPYRPYLPTRAHVAGAVDADLAIVVPSLGEPRATARGRAGLSRVDVRDGERTVMRVERVTATGIDVDWPGTVAVDRLSLVQPWVLLERDAKGELPLRALLPAQPADAAKDTDAARDTDAAAPLAVAVAHVSVDNGGLRVVDQKVSPPFAVDLQSAALKVDGLSTAGPQPARVELTGRLGSGADLTLRGTVGALGAPLRLDLAGELREFALPRTNPYLLQQVGWKTSEGRLTSKLTCRVDGDNLSVKTDIRLSHLQLVRASEHDGAQARIGLPLGVLTSLMKNRNGDINITLPIGGRVSDPKFDFSEAVWASVRSVAVHAIALPVSWIGRVRYTKDSRIDRIEIDPVVFEPGTPTPTPEGHAQVARLAAFLEELPEVRLSLTPVISSRDVDELRRRKVNAALERIARPQSLSRDVAVVRLFTERFPDRPSPSTPGAAFAMLLETETMSAAETGELATRRLEAVRATLERAGIHARRVPETQLALRDGREGQVEAGVLEPETARPSKVRDVLRRLGMPIKDSGADR
jgi:uncharacterized protein involved in outer membrane biogenesis